MGYYKVLSAWWLTGWFEFGLDSPFRWKGHMVSILLTQLLREERGKISQKVTKPELEL